MLKKKQYSNYCIYNLPLTASFQYMKHYIFTMSPLNDLRTMFLFYGVKTLFSSKLHLCTLQMNT